MEALLSWQTLFLAVSIFVMTWLFRRFVQTIKPALHSNKPARRKWELVAKRMWEGFFLPCLPILVGMVFCLLLSSFPYPASITTRSSRVLLGAVCGFFSGWGYHVVKSIVSKKFDVKLDEDPTLAPSVMLVDQKPTKKETKETK